MKIKQIINSKEGKYIISIILGLGLATMFREVCKDKTCIEFRAIGEKEIKDKIYKHDNKCYKYSLKSTSCGGNKQTVPIA
jgi:hypothetical protein|tara:strand:+ start:30 stop:269 length:240 start_codon:yes stop_codon:yes gene_type:complete